MKFQSNDSSGRSLAIAFDDEGAGDAVVLIHGFASSRGTNWRGPSWFQTFNRIGRRVIALDLRGHGESDKPHEEAAYDEALLAEDVVNLLDHLGLRTADLMGYSMGGFITLRLLMEYPQRFGRAIIGGVGENYFSPVTVNVDRVVAAMRAASGEAVSDPVAKSFRLFAESQGNDLEAMAACFARPRRPYTPAQLSGLSHPVLIVVGEDDRVIGSVEPLANAIHNAQLVVLKQRDHMRAVGDKGYKEAVTAFLAG